MPFPPLLPGRCSSAATRSWSWAIAACWALIRATSSSRLAVSMFSVGSVVMPAAYPIRRQLASASLNSHRQGRAVSNLETPW